MSIRFYDEETVLLEGLTVSLDGSYGDIKTKKFFLKNDNALVYYTDIILTLPNSEYSAGFMRDGYSIKLIASDTLPDASDWDYVGPGEPIQISDIGSAGNPDTTNYHSIYMRVACPANQPVSLVSDVSVRVSAIERLA